MKFFYMVVWCYYFLISKKKKSILNFRIVLDDPDLWTIT